jgi:hypothetical protein
MGRIDRKRDSGSGRQQWYIAAMNTRTPHTTNDATFHDLDPTNTVPTSDAERQADRQRWESLRERLDSRYTTDQVRAALQGRDVVEPEPDLSPAARALSQQLEEEALTATGRG